MIRYYTQPDKMNNVHETSSKLNIFRGFLSVQYCRHNATAVVCYLTKYTTVVATTAEHTLRHTN